MLGRAAAPVRVTSALIALVTAGAAPDSGLAAQVPDPIGDVRLSLGAVGDFSPPSGATDADQLLERALTVSERTGEQSLLLMAWRLKDGAVVRFHTSAPFAAGPEPTQVSSLGALPGAEFHAPVLMAESGTANARQPTASAYLAADPARFVASRVAGKPIDWMLREVMVLAAVPENEEQRLATMTEPVVLFGPVEEDESQDAAETELPRDGNGDPEVAAIVRRVRGQLQRCGGWVRNITLYVRNDMGATVPQYFEAFGDAPGCRIVPVTEYMDEYYHELGQQPPRMPPEMGQGLDILGETLEQELAKEGVPLPVSQMTDPLAEFADSAANVDRTPSDEMAGEEIGRVLDLLERQGRFQGRSEVKGRPSFTLGVPNLNLPIDRGFVLESVELVVDRVRFVPLRMTLAARSPEGRPLTIVRSYEQYRNYGSLQHPIWIAGIEDFQITGMGEAMSEGEREQMEQAMRQLAELEEQLASVPAAMRGMLQGQIDRLKAMNPGGSGGVFGALMENQYADVNAGPPYPAGHGSLHLEGNALTAEVLARWVPPYGSEPAPIYVPHYLEIAGQDEDAQGITNAWLQFSTPGGKGAFGPGLPKDALGIKNNVWWWIGGGMDYSKTYHVYGHVRGAYTREADGMTTHHRDLEPEPAILWFELTPTTAAGVLQSAAGARAYFNVGHMACSDQPRAVSASVFEYVRAQQVRMDRGEEPEEGPLEFDVAAPELSEAQLRGLPQCAEVFNR